jgi:hypothetical protein
MWLAGFVFASVALVFRAFCVPMVCIGETNMVTCSAFKNARWYVISQCT